MGNPKMYGINSTFTPNSKMDMLYRRKLYDRGRVIAERDPSEARERRQMKELERMKADAYRAG